MIPAISSSSAAIRAKSASIYGTPWMIRSIAIALALGLLLALLPLGIALAVVAAVLLVVTAYLKPELVLYLLMAAIIMARDTTEEVVSSGGIPFFADLKLMKGVPQASVAVLLVLFAVFFAKRLLLERKGSLISFWYLAGYFLLVLFAHAVGTQNGNDPLDIYNDVGRFIYPALAFYLCVNVLNSGNKIRSMLWVLIGACATKTLLLDINYLTGHGEPYQDSSVVTMDSAVLMAAGFLVSLVCALLLHRRRIKALPMVLLSMLPMTFALVFSFRRGHWVGQLASFALLYLLSCRSARKTMVYWALAGGVAGCLLLAVGGMRAGSGHATTSLVTRFESIFDPGQYSNRHHFEESAITLGDLEERPLLGMGLGGVHSAVPGAWREEDQPLHIVHNTFLYVWMKLGLPGLLLFLAAGAAFLKKLYQYRKIAGRAPNRPFVAGIGSGAGILLAMFATGPVAWYFHQTFLVVLFVAICLNLIRLDQHAVTASPAAGASDV
ncbi:MAG TPA: O-antigen ligase family protein [Geomonas sp.]|nr:O-antigen ligase family protein [Geomonas sp.]